MYDPDYISQREKISLEEAVVYIADFKARKATSRANYILKYGDKEGNEKFEEFKNRTLSAGHKLAKENGRSWTPRCVEFWIKKGHSLQDSRKKVSEFQHKNSPLHLEYWLKRGLSEEGGRSEIQKIHDKKKGIDHLRLQHADLTQEEYNQLRDTGSYASIQRRYPELTEEQVLERYLGKIQKCRKTREDKGEMVPLEFLNEYNAYQKQVSLHTVLSKKQLDLDNIGRCGVEGAHQLDHVFSKKQGFLQNVPAEIVGSIVNLQVIPWRDNVVKQDKCGITLEELYTRYYENKKNNS